MPENKLPELTPEEYNFHYRRIIKFGFLPFEAKEFLTAKGGKHHDVDSDIRSIVTSKPFESMLQDRLKWIHQCQQIGWSGHKIGQALKDYYKLEADRSPFDFLKIEYKPPQQLSDYAAAIKLRAETRIKRMSKTHFSINYTKRTKREWRPVGTPELKPNPIDNIWKGLDKEQSQ